MDIKREVKEEPTLTNKPPSLTHSDTPQKSQPSSASGATKSPSASQSTAGGSESSMNDTFEQPESDLQDLNVSNAVSLNFYLILKILDIYIFLLILRNNSEFKKKSNSVHRITDKKPKDSL